MAVVGLFETVQGAPAFVDALADAGITRPHPLGVVLAALGSVVLGLVALGPERTRRYLALARGQKEVVLLEHLTVAHRLNEAFRCSPDGEHLREIEAKLSDWLQRSRTLLVEHAPHTVVRYERRLRFLPSTGRPPDGDAFEAHGVLLDAIDAYEEALRSR